MDQASQEELKAQSIEWNVGEHANTENVQERLESQTTKRDLKLVLRGAEKYANT